MLGRKAGIRILSLMFTDLDSWGSFHYGRKMPYQGIQVFKPSTDLFKVPNKFMYVVGHTI